MFSQITAQLELIREGKAEPGSFFRLLWANGVLLKPEEYASLLSQAQQTLQTSPNIDALMVVSEIFDHYIRGRHVNMIEVIEEAEEKLRKLGDQEAQGAVLTGKAIWYINMGQLEKGLDHILQIIKVIPKNSIYNFFLRVSYYQAGELNNLLKDYAAAINYYNEGLEIAADDEGLTARMLNGIGNVHMNKGDLEKSLEYFNRSLSVCMKREDFLLETRNYSDIGTYYNLSGNTAKAKEYILKALDIRLKNTGQNKNQAIAPAITNYLQLANIHFKKEQFEMALHYANQALGLTIQLNLVKRMVETYDVLYKIYEAQGDTAKAFEHFKSYHKYKEEVFNQETSRKIKQMEMNHVLDSTQQEKEIFRLRNVELKSALDDIEASINYAKRLQDAMLPNHNLLHSSFAEFFVLYKPKDIVSGDFYWADKKDSAVFFAVGDCTGHGVPGAMVSILCQTALSRSLNEFNLVKPSEILNKTRELVIEAFSKSETEVKDGMDITFCSITQKENSENTILEFAGANNPLWIVSTQENEIRLEEIKADKQPIGFFPDMKSFTTHSFTIKNGTLLYLFSDGFADQFGGPNGKKFKYSNLKETLLSICNLPMAEQQKQLETILRDWKGNYEQIDDVTIMGIRL